MAHCEKPECPEIPTRTGKKNWIPVTVYTILKNSIYTGDLLLQKTYSEDTVPFVRRKNHGEYRQVLIQNDHEPIVTYEEYEAVQRMLKQKSNRTKENQEEQPEEIPEFKGKVICGICGSSYNRQAKKTGQAKAMSPGAVPDAYKQKTYVKMISSRKAS